MIKKLIRLFFPKILNNFEPVTVYGLDGKEKIKLIAKVDTGADRSSLDMQIAKKLGLLQKENIIATKEYRSGLGKQKRPIVKIKFKIKDKIVFSHISVTDRSHLKFPMLIGVRDMAGFLIKPRSRKYE